MKLPNKASLSYYGLLLVTPLLICSCGSQELVMDDGMASEEQLAAAVEHAEGNGPVDPPAALIESSMEVASNKKFDEEPAAFAKVLPESAEPVTEAPKEVAALPTAPQAVVANADVPKKMDTVAMAADQKELEQMIADSPSIVPPPDRPVRLGDATLNRYYFLRLGDTPESTALLLLASAQKSSDLIAWNQGIGKWTAGKTVLYRSASGKFENDMLSFYQEKNLAPVEYVVKSGESLSTIAEKRYGDKSAWREIATINGLRSPQSLVSGQKLVLYPSELPRLPMEQAVAAMAHPETQPENIVEEVEVPSPAVTRTAKNIPPQAKIAQAQLASADGIGSFFEHHYGILLVLIAASGTAAFFLNRRRRLRSNLWY